MWPRGLYGRFTSARRSVAEFFCSIERRSWILSNSPRSAKYAPQASPTFSSPCWTIRSAQHKEQLDEYSIGRPALFSASPTERRPRHSFADQALLLVHPPRILGEPLD